MNLEMQVGNEMHLDMNQLPNLMNYAKLIKAQQMIQRAKLAEYLKSLTATSSSHSDVANLNGHNLTATNLNVTTGSLANSLTGDESPTSSTNATLSPTFTSSPTLPSPFLSTPLLIPPGYQLSPSPPGYSGQGSSSSSSPGPKTPPAGEPPSKKAKIDHFETRLMILKLSKLQNQNSKFKKNLFSPIAEKKRKINFAKQINNFIKQQVQSEISMLKMKQAVQEYRSGNYLQNHMTSIPKPVLITSKPESTSPKPISPKSSSPTSSIGSSICEVDRNKKSRRLQNTIDKIRSMNRSIESPTGSESPTHRDQHSLRPSRSARNRHFRNHEDSSGHGSLNDTSSSSSSEDSDEFEIIDVVNV